MSVHSLSLPPLEFEGRALAKAGLLSTMALAVVGIIEWGPIGFVEADTFDPLIDLLSAFGEFIERAEDVAPGLLDLLGSGDMAIVEQYCELTTIRVLAYTTARADRLFILDFDILRGDTDALLLPIVTLN